MRSGRGSGGSDDDRKRYESSERVRLRDDRKMYVSLQQQTHNFLGNLSANVPKMLINEIDNTLPQTREVEVMGERVRGDRGEMNDGEVKVEAENACKSQGGKEK